MQLPFRNDRYCGVVSLLDMLEFAATEFIELSHRFGMLMGAATSPPNPDVLGDSLSYLLENGEKLGLQVTVRQLVSLIVEINEQSPGAVEITDERIIKVKGSLDYARSKYYVESLYSTMLAEMGSIQFRAIPRDRTQYCDLKWLSGTETENKFPTSFREFQRSGTCYAFGQSTASVFHSMRGLEPGLNSLADKFNVLRAHENWQQVITGIESAVRNLGNQPKTQQKIDDEKFFGAAASELYFIKNAWRNHVAHMRDSYSDDEALKILQHSVQFVESLCARLQESPS